MADSKTTISRKAISAMIEFKKTIAEHRCMGRQRIVSMQELEKVGLVKCVSVNGMIADWTITEAGKAWTP